MEITIRSVEEFDKQIKRLSKKYQSLASDFQSFVVGLKNNPLQGTDLGGGIRK